MAKQVLLEELHGCKTYLGWIIDCLDMGNYDASGLRPPKFPDEVFYKLPSEPDYWLYSLPTVSRELCRVLFSIEFTWTVEEDSIRATDALEIRKIYAKDVGEKAGKSERDIDRIRKSVHGKASVLEVIFSLCRHLDGMVNEDEPCTMIGFFYRILIGNLKLDEFSDGDFKPIVYGASDLKEAGELSKAIDACIKRNFGSEENMLRRETEIKKIWFSRVKKWLDRDYFESGCEGGMFPLHEWKPGDKDQKTVSLWYQMNTWLNEHLDDEERFIVEKAS